MGCTAYTAALDGTGRVPLDSLGTISGLTFANNTTGGDTDCQLSLDLPVSANPPGLTPGRLLIVHSGPQRVWSGLLADPTRGTPWQVTGQSLASLAANYLALSSGAATTNANLAVDGAISRGLPWTRTQTLPTPSVTPSGDDVGALLDEVALVGGQQWQVDQYGYVSMTAVEATPSLLLTAVDVPGGRTLDAFVTAVWIKHCTSSTSTAATLTPAPNNPTGAGPWGRKETVIDRTTDGVLTVANAQALGNAVLAAMRPSPQFTGAVQVHSGDLTTIGGQPVALATVRAGQRVAIIGAQPDPALGELLPTTRVETVIGEWRYSADTDTAQLTPLGAPKRDLQTILTAAAALLTKKGLL